MVLGEEVQGIFALAHDWRFVTGDASGIHTRVREIHPDARLVANAHDGRLGVAVWVQRSKMGDGDIEDSAGVPVQDKGGAFVLALPIRDEDGFPYKGEPDQRVVDQLNRASTTRKREDLEKFAELEAARHEALVAAWERDLEAASRPAAELSVFGHHKLNGIRAPRIFVPTSLNN